MRSQIPVDMRARRLTGEPFDPTSVTPFDRIYDQYRLTPTIVIGRSLLTRQVPLVANQTRLVIEPTVAKFYSLVPGDTSVVVFIGNREVTVQSGFRVASDAPLVFALLENTGLYAVAPVDTLVHVLDMGL